MSIDNSCSSSLPINPMYHKSAVIKPPARQNDDGADCCHKRRSHSPDRLSIACSDRARFLAPFSVGSGSKLRVMPPKCWDVLIQCPSTVTRYFCLSHTSSFLIHSELSASSTLQRRSGSITRSCRIKAFASGLIPFQNCGGNTRALWDHNVETSIDGDGP